MIRWPLVVLVSAALASEANAQPTPAEEPAPIELTEEDVAKQEQATEPVAAQTPPVTPAAAAPATVVESKKPEERKTPWIRPFAAVVGGIEVEMLQTRPGDDREGRTITLALSRFGLRAGIAKGISLESEFEANAGPHGTSAWEGQAALSVRNQYVRFERWNLRVDAGRVTDPASVDYLSAHVGDQLYTDGYTRGQLLASGFNRGNGVLARYQIAPVIEVGLAVNAANPVSTTSSLIVGGTFPPFARFYFAPYQYVGRDAANFPADEFHIVVVTPSAKVTLPFVELQAALQMLKVDTNKSSSADQNIDGYNIRVGAASTFANGMVRAFANGSLVQNEVVDPNDGTMLSGDVFTGLTASGGVDVQVIERLGVGVQGAWIHDHQAGKALADQYLFNLGSTFWLASRTALAARFGYYRRCERDDMGACLTDGERSIFFTLRTEI